MYFVITFVAALGPDDIHCLRTGINSRNVPLILHDEKRYDIFCHQRLAGEVLMSELKHLSCKVFIILPQQRQYRHKKKVL